MQVPGCISDQFCTLLLWLSNIVQNLLSYPCNQSPQNKPFLLDISGIFETMWGTNPKISCKDIRLLLVYKMCANSAQIILKKKKEIPPNIKFRGHLFIHVYEICIQTIYLNDTFSNIYSKPRRCMWVMHSICKTSENSFTDTAMHSEVLG